MNISMLEWLIKLHVVYHYSNLYEAYMYEHMQQYKLPLSNRANFFGSVSSSSLNNSKKVTTADMPTRSKAPKNPEMPL